MDGDVSKPVSKAQADLERGLKAFLEKAGCENVKTKAVAAYDIERDVTTIRIEITADVR